MQSRDDDVTLSADIVERWLDSNVDWLARYLQHRKPFHDPSTDEVCQSATTSPNDVIATGPRPGSSVTTTSSSNVSETESGAAPIQMPFVRTRCSNRGSLRGDSSSVRRSTSWTRKELAMSRDNGLGNTTSSPNLIVLTGDCCPVAAVIQQQAVFVNGNPVLFQSDGSHQHHQRSNSKKHLRYDFARSRVGRCINGKTTSSAAAPTHQQQQQQHQTNAASATTCNNGNGGNGSAMLTAEPSFASFDGFLDAGLDELLPSDARTIAERRRSSIRGLRQCMSLPPPSSGSTLRMLIESRVHLPRGGARHAGTVPLDELQTKRELNSRLNSRDFFLEIVRDVSCDLDLDNLVRKILVNVTVLVSAERVTLHVVEGSSQYPTGNSNVALVLHSYDARDHADDRYSSVRDTRVSASAPWGHGVVGYVAETGNFVNTSTNAQIEVSERCPLPALCTGERLPNYTRGAVAEVVAQLMKHSRDDG